MKNFNWESIHNKCELNIIRDKLWVYSRFYAIRFENIINMMEDEYYFEALINLIILMEQFWISKTNKLNMKFSDLIDKYFIDSKKSTAHSLRNLRNAMAHKFLFKYYVKFDSVEYPLDEINNYCFMIEKLFLPIISCFDDDYHETIDFVVYEYKIEELAKQYGITDYIKILNIGLQENMSEKEKNERIKKNEYELMRIMNNSSPVAYYTSIFKELFKNN